MLQEILLNEPEETKNNENLNFYDKPFLNLTLNKRDFVLSLNENINNEMDSNISLKEMENIMKDSPKNEFDEDDSTDIYFTKSSKIDLQSTDCSTKIFSLTDKDEICKDFFRTVLHKKRGRKKEKEEKE